MYTVSEVICMDHDKTEYWNTVIADYMSSGLTQKEYARQNNLKLSTLGYWVRKHNTSFNGFIEAKETAPVLDNASKIEISFNKMKIAITGTYDEELLLRVLRTVKNV
jgi:transposase-like protein